MLAKNDAKTFDLTAPRKLLRLLEALKRTDVGATLYRHLEGVVEEIESTHLDVEHGYANLLTTLVESVTEQLPEGSPLRVEARLLQMRLAPPLSALELQVLQRHMSHLAKGLADTYGADEEAMLGEMLGPVLQAFTFGRGQAEPGLHGTASQVEADEETTAQAEQRVDQAYRHHLNEKREGIQRIQDTLAHQVTETIRQNEEFGSLLSYQLEALRRAADYDEVEALRASLIQEVEKLQKNHRELAAKLDTTHDYLNIIETDAQQLSEELTRVHLLSLTDELTELPNRRAFMRRLEDEVSRVQRYGNPLTLAVLDLDAFKEFNDRYGHGAGDEVLRVFAQDILSVFRHHDMVARYGGEEFAVLLPNTHSEGAMRALRKVQKRTAEGTFQHAGSAIPLPSFSAGIALYRPGENPETFIERADGALYEAKRLGRNRIEMDPPSTAGSQFA